MFSAFFVLEGCEVTVANNGAMAVEKIQSGKNYDLVLMDMEMPVMNGLEAVMRIRAMPDMASVPVIGIGANEGNHEACIAAGMTDIMPKPLSTADLSSIVRRFLYRDNPRAFSQKPSETGVMPNAKADALQLQPGNRIFDYKRALDEFMNDELLLKRVVAEFNTTLESQIETMNNALESMNFDILRKESHRIKGAALNICAKNLSESALALEIAARDHNDASVKQALATLVDAVAEFAAGSKQ
jgi:CheY-like chemotaxis protein